MSDVLPREPCDWCGRPGKIRQHEYWQGDVLVCRDPSLCDVCEFVRNLPGDVEDAIHESGIDYEAILMVLEDELERKWRKKVAGGKRTAQRTDEAPGLSVNIVDR